MSSLTIHFDENPDPDELKQILDGVRAHTRAVAGLERPRPVACYLRDENARIVGGAHGDLWGSAVHIDAMWVRESHRGKGYGSALLSAVESYAASRGHLLAYLETTRFQARPFYEGLGYRVFGELPGVAEGCTMFFLRKDLKAPASPAQ
jgi:GNAT superfamily N-acetyltransferase